MIRHLRRHWFLALLVVVLSVGLEFGPRLAGLLSQFPRGSVVMLVMILTALPMSFGQLTSAARQTRVVSLALLLSMVVAPPLAWLIGQLLPTSLAIGLIVAAAVPCTLASAAVWTRRGGGNDAIALLVTLITNLACFGVLPAWLWFLLRAEVPLDAWALSMRLLLLVVAPVLVAQMLRVSPAVANTATVYKPMLSHASQLGVLTMVFFGAVNAGNTLFGLESSVVGMASWGKLLAAALALHLLLFAAGWLGSHWLGASNADQLAVAIAGSQKTLMIGLDVAMGLGGLAVLPMVAYHITQLVVDTLLVDWLRVTDEQGSASR